MILKNLDFETLLCINIDNRKDKSSTTWNWTCLIAFILSPYHPKHVYLSCCWKCALQINFALPWKEEKFSWKGRFIVQVLDLSELWRSSLLHGNSIQGFPHVDNIGITLRKYKSDRNLVPFGSKEEIRVDFTLNKLFLLLLIY